MYKIGFTQVSKIWSNMVMEVMADHEMRSLAEYVIDLMANEFRCTVMFGNGTIANFQFESEEYFNYWVLRYS